jgi:hypothetical protein
VSTSPPAPDGRLAAFSARRRPGRAFCPRGRTARQPAGTFPKAARLLREGSAANRRSHPPELDPRRADRRPAVLGLAGARCRHRPERRSDRRPDAASPRSRRGRGLSALCRPRPGKLPGRHLRLLRGPGLRPGTYRRPSDRVARPGPRTRPHHVRQETAPGAGHR